MSTDYDRWLESPYQDRFAQADEYEKYAEAFGEGDTDEYAEALEAFLKANPTLTEKDFYGTDEYEKAEQAYVEFRIADEKYWREMAKGDY